MFVILIKSQHVIKKRTEKVRKNTAARVEILNLIEGSNKQFKTVEVDDLILTLMEVEGKMGPRFSSSLT